MLASLSVDVSYLREAQSQFCRATLSENCSLLVTDNLGEDLAQMEAIVFVSLQIFFSTRAVLKIGEYNII